MLDEESRLLYHKPAAKGQWPQIAGYLADSTDYEGKEAAL